MIEKLNNENKSSFEKLYEKAVADNEFADIEFVDREKQIFLYKEGKKYVAFIICAIRKDPVLGCGSANVGYIEALFVQRKYRDEGKEIELINAFEDWAREHNCYELAGDISIKNKKNLEFYEQSGFDQIGTNIHFRKRVKSMNL